MSLLGRTLLGLGRFEEAKPLLTEAVAQLQSTADTPSVELEKARARLAEYEAALAAQSAPDSATP